MTISLARRGVRGVVLDIEGTTTPVSFVYDVLFPHARAHLRAFLRERHAGDEAALDAVVARFESLMDTDSKDPELKLLQGQIWERGYGDGTLKGEVFADVPPALARWRDAGVEIAIYSSGSVLAQRLLFGSTAFGDLTLFVSQFFDTSVGPKRSPESYQRIADEMRHPGRELLFISDVSAELDAARGAGLQALLCVRPGNAEQAMTDVEIIRSFDELGT